jgi:surface antigen
MSTRTLAILGALALPLAIAPAAQATSLSVARHAAAGKRATARIVAPDRATYCRLSARRRGGGRAAIPVQVSGSHLRVTWRVPRAVRRGTYTLAAGCGETRRAAATARPEVATMRVSGKRGGTRNVLSVRGLRVSTGGAGRGASKNPFAVASGILWCTWWAYVKRPDIYDAAVANGGPRWDWDAYTWADRAQRWAHLPVGRVPVVGAIAVYSREYYGYPSRAGGAGALYGHVAFVESVDGAGYTVSQHGGDRLPAPYYRHHPMNEPNVVFIYGGPAGNGPSSAPAEPAPQPQPATPAPTTPSPSTGTPSTPAPQPQPQQTWAETTGGVTNTWSNYTNAGGTHGPSIATNQTVQVACKLQGFRVADGNTWWYRIASSPWNGAYYASADAFYNNGATSGPLKGTPYVDPNVAPC